MHGPSKERTIQSGLWPKIDCGDPIIYEKNISFGGDPTRAMRLAEQYLAECGYEITIQSASAIGFRGPGKNRPRKDLFAGLSNGRITVEPNTISIDAEFGIFRLTKIFHVGISVMLVYAAVMKAAWGDAMNLMDLLRTDVIITLVAVPVVILFARFVMRRSSVAAIDQLANAMATAAER